MDVIFPWITCEWNKNLYNSKGSMKGYNNRLFWTLQGYDCMYLAPCIKIDLQVEKHRVVQYRQIHYLFKFSYLQVFVYCSSILSVIYAVLLKWIKICWVLKTFVAFIVACSHLLHCDLLCPIIIMGTCISLVC